MTLEKKRWEIRFADGSKVHCYADTYDPKTLAFSVDGQVVMIVSGHFMKYVLLTSALTSDDVAKKDGV